MQTIINSKLDQKWNKFFAIINSKIDAELVTRLAVEIFPKMSKLVNNKNIEQHVKLSLAFLNGDDIRDHFFSIEDKHCDDLISLCTRRIFVIAIVDKKHFIETLINCDMTNTSGK